MTHILSESEIKTLFSISEITDLQLLLADEERYDDHPNGRISCAESFGMHQLGEGNFSVVIAHPAREDLVIRVSQHDDGWIGYAMGPPNPFKPVVHALGWTGDAWVAITDKLIADPRHEIVEVKMGIIAMSMMINADDESDMIPAMRKMLHQHPVRARVKTMSALFTDTRERGLIMDDIDLRNVMARPNGHMIINDPVSYMPRWMEYDLRTQFQILPDEPDSTMRIP